MTYFVKHRYTNSILFESETATTVKEALTEAVKGGADLGGADLGGADLGGADLGGADLRGADLGDADLGGADLGGADLGGADLRGADLRGADLGGAYLRGADLGDADLGGADLGGADLRDADLGAQWIIQGQVRSDGYAFFLQHLKDDAEPMVKAGCRYFTLTQAQAHWEASDYRGGEKLAKETRTIVRAMIDTMHIRGLK